MEVGGWKCVEGDLCWDSSEMVETKYRREGTCRSVVLCLDLKGLAVS